MPDITITGTPVTAPDIQDYVNRVRDLVDDICGLPGIAISSPTGGSLLAGYVSVRVSSVTEFGETLACSRVTAAVTEDDELDIVITRVPQANSYRVYAAFSADGLPESGTETLQTEVAISQAATQTVILEEIVDGTSLSTENTGTVLVPYRSYEDAVAAAANEYSMMFPQELYQEDTLTNGIKEYDLPLGYFNVVRIQYPLEDYPPIFLDDADYFVKDEQWCFVSINPTTGEEARVYYTTSWEAEDIPSKHFEPVCNLAAAVVCEQLASRYTRMSRRQIGADSVDYKMRASDSKNDAIMFRKSAYRLLGVADIKHASATARFDWYEEH